MERTRRCRSCGDTKSLDEYYYTLCGRPDAPKGKRYHERVCKVCKQKKKVERMRSKPESFLAHRLSQLKYARNKRGKEELKITAQDLIAIYRSQRGRCALSGIPMTHNGESGKAHKRNSLQISIDRIDPDGPYEKENIQLVCSVVNFMKGTIDNDDFIRFCSAISDFNP